MDILISALKNEINKYSKVAIYGCGKFAEETYLALCKCGREPSFCVVTQKSDTPILFKNAIPIYNLSEQATVIKEENILVIVGVSSLYEKQIEETLKEYQIKQYLLISSFERLEVYKRFSPQECMEEIVQWYIDKYSDEVAGLDRQSVLKELNEAIKREKNSKKIVFAMGALTPRVLKVADALLEKGYQIKLIANSVAVMQDFCEAGLKKLNLSYVKCETLEEFLYQIIMENSKIIHLFTNISNSHIDRILIKNKELFSPIVYDEYDIYNLCYEGLSQGLLKNERFCLENADGVCNRGYEINYLIENGFRIGKGTIQFHDYCSNKPLNLVEHSFTQEENDEVSLCYIGGMLQKSQSAEWADNIFECARRCAENHCHFHVYPHRWDEVQLKDYIELEKTNDYFHLHHPVSYDELKSELSKYDYGIFPIRKAYVNQGIPFVDGAVYKKEQLLYATGNKYFDYLDAGLPIIAACPQKLMQFLGTKDVVLNWTVEEYDFEEIKNRRRELKKNVVREHYGLQMRQHINELTNLYDFVENERNKS